ncbi:ISLre2 family transposase, partial [Thermovorax subterraneus]|nr:ISLre2 family transposase [Thermovorax subterraneus]
KLLGYLKDNWEGIVNSPAAERLGTIEGQIQHNVARRMKRRGARWSESGADRMTRILAEKANGKLEEYAMRWPMKQKKIKEIVTEIAQTEEKKKAKVEDIEKWLKVSLPILNGPHASKPWIKYVLKELSRSNFSAMI